MRGMTHLLGRAVGGLESAMGEFSQSGLAADNLANSNKEQQNIRRGMFGV